MGNMNGWDVAVLVAAGYIAATALVRLMIRRRDQMLDDFREQMKAEEKRKKREQREKELLQYQDRAA
jgi:hypothetical protein